MKFSVPRLALGCLAACLVAAGEARAGLITAGTSINQSLSRNAFVTFDGVDSAQRAGQFETTVYDDGSPIISGASYCVDLTERVNSDIIHATVYTTSGVVSPSGERNDVYPRLMGAAGWLVSHIAPTTSFEHAALQVAIWEAIYDFDYGANTPLGSYVDAATALSTGLFMLRSNTNANITALAVQYLTAAWNGSRYRVNDALIVDYPPPGGRPFSQDQVMVTPVPEPSSMVLLGCGALGLFGLSRRRRPR